MTTDINADVLQRWCRMTGEAQMIIQLFYQLLFIQLWKILKINQNAE